MIEEIALTTILIINDDGIHSIGLLALKKHLEKLGKVIVVAPRDERSGIGKALTASGHVKIMETRLDDGSKAYAITGTPADAYFLAVNKIIQRLPDLLVAGINLGPNLGIDDLLNSGTLGAAMEAAIHGVPAIAVSYCIQAMNEAWEKAEITLKELESAASIAQRVSEYVLKKGMPLGVGVISINVPEKADLKRVEVTRLSYKGYDDIYTEQREGYKIMGWSLDVYPDDEPGTDVYAIKEKGCISVTPIVLRFPYSKKELEDLSKVLAA